MTVVTAISSVMLLAAASLTTVRLLAGPSVADRMIALDTLLFIGIGALGVRIIRTGDTTYVPVLVVAVLTAFLGTVVVARYLEAERDR